jgi:hypothetical protein
MSAPINIDWRSEAERFYAHDLRAIPFWVDADGNTGYPTSWRQYETCELSVLRSDDFWNKYGRRATGLALIMGKGWEAIDVDHKADPTGRIKKEYIEAVQALGGEEALQKCIGVRTKSGGLHFVYRAPNVQGNQKLAARPTEVDGIQKPETLVETRGNGGFLYVAPTPGYSLMNSHYSEAQLLTEEERNILIQAGRVCDRMPQEDQRQIRKMTKALPKGEGVTPWDAFNEATDALDMMEELGWTVLNQRGDFVRLNRPGHKNPRQASGSVILSKNIFYPFTTSTRFTSERGYSPFAIYALTAHHGDFSEAARELYKDGFGDRRGKKTEQQLDGSRESIELAIGKVLPKPKEEQLSAADELKALLDEVDDQHKFSIHDELEEIDFCLYYVDPVTGEETGLSAMGMFGLMVGLQKSAKTTLLISFVVAALTGKTFLHFRFDLKGKNIIWLDCEQPKYWFQVLCKRIYKLSGLKDDSPRFQAYSLRRYSKAQRATLTAALLLREDNLGLGVIDGLVDICQDFNDVQKSELTIDQVLEWSDRSNALLMGVIHLTKGMGYIKGHLGTIAQNKCDFALETKKEDEPGCFQVFHREARGKQVEGFRFYRDENGDPITQEEHDRRGMQQTADYRADQRESAIDQKQDKPYGQLAIAGDSNNENIPF